MATIRRVFEWGTDEEFGGTGWIPKGLEGALQASTEGRMVAHDALEHMPGPYSHCAATDECVALGAALYGRGEMGMLKDPVRGIASDLASILRDHGTRPVLTPPKYRADPRSSSMLYRVTLERIVAQAVTDTNNDHDDDNPFEDAEGSVRDCIAWVVYGYRKAARRWGSPHRAAAAFHAVADVVNRVGAGCNEGAELVVTVSPSRGTAEYWVGYPEGYGEAAVELDSGFSRFASAS
jgi:hypothetical protein